MKTKILLSLCVILLSLVLAACSHPPPLPEPPPTPIPTLIPATEPPPGAQNTPQPGVTLPTSPPDATAGLAVFQEQCAGCHGADGKGKVEGSRNFTDVDYMRGAAPRRFLRGRHERQGRHARVQGQAVPTKQRWNAIWSLWSFAVPAAEIAQGKTVYESAGCVNCHGANGQGAIPQARKFTADFVPQHPAQQYYQSVSAGKGIMPAHQDRLSAEERWAAVEYVRTFGYKPASK